MTWPSLAATALGSLGPLAGFAVGWRVRGAHGRRPLRRLRAAGYKRLTVDVPGTAWSNIHSVAAERGCSIDESIANAGELDHWVWAMVRDGNSTLELRSLDDSAPAKYLRLDRTGASGE